MLLPLTPHLSWLIFNTQDIDIVVSDESWEGLDPEDLAEDIKDTIKQADRRYYLEQSK